MAQFENMRKVDLANGEPAVFSLRQLYYADENAHRIGAIVYMDGEPFALSGTCSGTAIRADGTTVPMTGTVEGNQAYITLIADCYAVEGDIQIFVKLTTGDVTATLAAARGTVRLTETGAVIDPGEIIPSVSALITAINDAVESIPADYSALLAAIAPAYADLSFPVTAGTWCWYSGSLYRAKVDIPASETWTAAHWETAPLSNALAGDVAALKSAIKISNNDITANYKTLMHGSLASGVYAANESWRATDYIPVIPGAHYVFHGYMMNFSGDNYNSNIWAYDENKSNPAKLYHHETTAGVVDVELEIPSNVYYIRWSLTKGAYESATEFYCYCNLYDATNDFYTNYKPLIITPEDRADISIGYKTFLEGYINANGVFVSSSSWRATDFIPVIGGTVLHVDIYRASMGPGFNTIWFYNNAKETISGAFPYTDTYGEIDSTVNVPTNAAYVRYMTSKTYANNGFVLDYTDSLLKIARILGEKSNKLSGEYVKMNHVYVATSGNDTTGDGSQSAPFATIKHANDSITDNSEYNEYTIHVADGTYTDLQTLYSGTTGIDSYEGVLCKNHVYYIGNVEHPENVVITWDGKTGYDENVFNYNDYAIWKCPFHITNTRNGGGVTAIRGMTLNCQNTRYALHIETSGEGWGVNWEISDMRFVWNGTPDCHDINFLVPTVGTGCGNFEKGRILRCKFINATGLTEGFVNHDSSYKYGTKFTVHEGANITLESCVFNGGSAGSTCVKFRNLYSDASVDGYNRCNIINCIGISDFVYVVGGTATEMTWRALVKCSDITNNQFQINNYMQ